MGAKLGDIQPCLLSASFGLRGRLLWRLDSVFLRPRKKKKKKNLLNYFTGRPFGTRFRLVDVLFFVSLGTEVFVFPVYLCILKAVR